MRLVATAAALLALLAIPTPAHAQFGGIARRVAERAIKDKTAPGRDGRAPLTDAAVTRALAGFAEEAKMADEIGRATLAAHAADVRAINEFLKRRAAWDAVIAANVAETARYQKCSAGGSAELTRLAIEQVNAPGPTAPQREMAQKMMARMQDMSPAEQEAMMKKAEQLEKEAKAAERSRNPAEKRRIAAETEKLLGVKMDPAAAPDPAVMKADAARADAMKAASGSIKKCGTPRTQAVATAPEFPRVPAVPSAGETPEAGAVETITDSVDARSYLARLRSAALGNRAAERGASAAGLSAGDYGLVREKLLLTYARRVMEGDATRPQQFTEDEWRMLGQYRTQLVAVAQRLEQSGAL